ncbi:hypothetical protein ACLMJK_006362 [Lecanora helva]
MLDQKASEPVLAGVRSSKLFVYIVVNLAVFIDAYIYGLIIPVLPFALVERTNLPENQVQQWIGILLAAYGGGMIIGSPVAGSFADHANSRRGPYLCGLIALAFSTIAFSFGRTAWILLVGRLVQGFSSAAVHTVGVAILADTVGQGDIGPAMGFVAMSMALGAVAGPAFGGILYHNLGYLAVFVSAYVLVALDFVLRVLMISEKEDKLGKQPINDNHGRNYGTSSQERSQTTGRQLPIRTPSTSESPLLFQPTSTTSPSTSSSSSLSTTPTTSTTTRSPSPIPSSPPPKTHRHPLLTLLTHRRMLAALLGDFIQSLILTLLESALPLRIKTIFHYNSQLVALVFLSLALTPLSGPLFGHLADRYGTNVLVSVGLALAGPFLMGLGFVDHYSPAQVGALCGLLVLLGLSLNMILTPVYSEATYLIDDMLAEDENIFGGKGAHAQAFGLMNAAYAVGSLVGPLMGGLVLQRVGWKHLMLGLGVACFVCLGPVFGGMGGRRRRGRGNGGGDGEGEGRRGV